MLPPLGMSTGLAMFVWRPMWIPWSWAAAAFGFGFLVLSWPLARASRLEHRADGIYLRRSRAFLAILLGLLGIRLALHDWIGHLVSARQTASLFFLIAFGMILRWRAGMLRQFRVLEASAPTTG